MSILGSGYAVKAQPTAIGTQPVEGAKVYPIQYTLSAATATNAQTTSLNLDDIGLTIFQGLFVDNSDTNSVPVVFTMQDSGQKVEVPPESQAFIPVLSIGAKGTAASFTVAAASLPAADYVLHAQILNFPTQLAIWSTTSSTAGFRFDGSGNLDVNVQVGGGTGGTASTFGSAFPGSGTAAGFRVVSAAQSLTAGNMGGASLGIDGSLWTVIKGPLDGSGNVSVDLQTPIPAGGNAIGSVTVSSGSIAITGTSPVNLTEISGAAVVAAAAGVPRVGIAGSANAALDSAAGSASAQVLSIQGNAAGIAVPVTPAPVAPAASAHSIVALVKALMQLKGTAAVIRGFDAYNVDATVSYVQIFFLPSASVTLGTTAPDLSYAIPPSGWFGPNLPLTGAGGNAINAGRGSGLSWAVTTGANNSVLATTGCYINGYWD